MLNKNNLQHKLIRELMENQSVYFDGFEPEVVIDPIWELKMRSVLFWTRYWLRLSLYSPDIEIEEQRKVA